ncbi:peptidylprolyl isomerase [Methylophaga nitratireducenticrescens]|uniref:peptidylprolyl isomerase n=1 Tax=Methylophaga nitratireducenticrescens TaxID=754476 RepID=I1XG10_METNJ|nr:peptidylprolyl isomerase [Methylophaga nitratireducenticrescens]AFI83329.1 peptidylprolyl isomerase [Methylophaga nitratireducenticrescens]AUZ83449.1 peptidylprolyl isomerase [Methylophaga nitratireducenticrescens]
MIKVNNVEISDSAVLAEMQYHPAASHDAAFHKAAQCLVIAEVMRQQAIACGISTEDYQGTDYIDELIDIEVEVPQASQDECYQYYQANPDKFCTSPLIAARHILIAAHPEDPQAREEALNLSESLINKITLHPESFGDLAKQYSHCDSAKHDGQLGQLSRGQTVSEFERQVFAAPLGLIPRPVETRFGFHVVWVDQHIDGELLPYEHVVKQISEYLDNRVQHKAYAQYIEYLLSEAEIEGIEIDVSGSPLMQ